MPLSYEERQEHSVITNNKISTLSSHSFFMFYGSFFMLSSYLHTHISHCLVLLTFVHTSVIALIPLIGVSSWNMAFFWWETMKKWETDRHCSWGRRWQSERMKTKKMEGAAKVRKGIWKTPALSQVQQCVYSCKVCGGVCVCMCVCCQIVLSC